MLWDGLLVALYREMAVWLRQQLELGSINVADPTATAAVLMTSLTYYRCFRR